MDEAEAASGSTIDRVIQVLLALGERTEPVGVTELASDLHMSKTVVHRILQRFLDHGLAEQDRQARRYSPGPRSWAGADGGQAQSALLTAAQPALEYLSALTNETVTLCKRVGFHEVYIAQIVSSLELHISVPLWQKVPLTLGANGLCQLAFLDEDFVELALALPREAQTERTIVDADRIRTRLSDIRTAGFAFTAGERVPMCSALAVPILLDSDPVGSLGISYLDSRFEDVDRAHIVDEMKKCSALVARRMTALTKPSPPRTNRSH